MIKLKNFQKYLILFFLQNTLTPRLYEKFPLTEELKKFDSDICVNNITKKTKPEVSKVLFV